MAAAARHGTGEQATSVASPHAEAVDIGMLTSADIPVVAALYAAAFARNSAYCEIFRLPAGSDAQRAALEWFFACRLRALLASRATLLVARTRRAGRIIGAVGLVPPDRRPSMLIMLRHGMLAWICAQGLASLLRALALDAAISHSGHAASEVVMMAVMPGCQGEGVGTRLLARLLAQHDDAGGGAVVLSTQEHRNLSFYSSAGFRVIGEARIPCDRAIGDGTGAFTSWKLFRDAKGAADGVPDGGSKPL